MSKYILGIDEGTTSVRVGLFDVDKKCLIDVVHKKIDVFLPHEAWVEQDGNQIFSATENLIKDIVLKNNTSARDILAISITNQRETTLAWDKTTGECVYPAINWQCRRTAKIVEDLDENQKTYLKNTTGLIPDAYFSASKIKWLCQNNAKVQQLAKENKLAFGTIESYLIFALTKGKSFVTDVTNASRTMLMSLETCSWDDGCLEIFGIDKNWLGKIVCNDEVVGFYELDGVLIPICGVIGDQQASLFGQMCFESGECKVTYGTGCFLVMNTGKKILNNPFLLSTVGYKTKGQDAVYALEGSVFNAGSCIDLLKDWELISDASQIDTICQSVPDSGKIVFVPALTGLGAPYWDMGARAIFVGMTRATKKAHLVRAVVESIAFSCLDLLLEMQTDVGKVKQLKCDGGVSQSQFLMQFQSDIASTKLTIPLDFEMTLLGSIYMALLGMGICEQKELKSMYKVKTKFLPNMDVDTIKRKYLRWRRAVLRSLRWAE